MIISIPSGTIAIVEGSCGLCILQPVLCIAIVCYVSGGVAFNIFQTLARVEHKTITIRVQFSRQKIWGAGNSCVLEHAAIAICSELHGRQKASGNRCQTRTVCKHIFKAISFKFRSFLKQRPIKPGDSGTALKHLETISASAACTRHCYI